MNIIDRTQQNNSYYTQVYDQSYITDHLKAGNDVRLRLSSQWWAARAAVGCDPHSPSVFPGVTFKKQILFANQIEYLKQNATRKMQQVMEIGSAAGELSAVLAATGAEVYSVDSNPHVVDYHRRYLNSLNVSSERYNLWLGSAVLFADQLPQKLDTVILVESLEHFIPSEWEQFWQQLKPILKSNSGRLIITNPIWPLVHNGWDHIMSMDDAWFDQLIDGDSALYRNRGYLCIQY